MILESRDRIGGRILQTLLDNVTVDLGSTFVIEAN